MVYWSLTCQVSYFRWSHSVARSSSKTRCWSRRSKTGGGWSIDSDMIVIGGSVQEKAFYDHYFIITI